MASKEDSGEASGSSGSGERSHEVGSRLPDDEDGTVELIRRYLAEKLGFYNDDSTDKSEKPKFLDEISIDGIVQRIKDGEAKNIVTMAGAGISTSAGIPDFRSPGSGLYNNLQKYNLPYPQAIFEICFFRKNPQPFFTLAKELYPGTFKPTVCHYFIKLLNEKGLLLRHYTQNIDTLERVAGLPEDKLVEAHGTFYTSHCLECNKEYSIDWMRDHIFQDNVPTCTSCNGIVKPDIVFFGECLPQVYHTRSEIDFPKTDLLIIMGTSLAVQPFASLIDKVGLHCPRLMINREKAGHRDKLMQRLYAGCGLDFDSFYNTRDVLWQGDCNEGCQLMADKLGWGDELRAMVKEGHKKIDDEMAKEKNLNSTPKKPTDSKSHQNKDESTKKEESSSSLPAS